MEPQRKRRNLTQGEFFGSLMYHEPSDPRLICLGKKRKIRFSIQEFILGFCDLMLRFKRLRNDVFFVFFSLFSQHHCRICGRIFCHNCSNNWLQTPHSRYLSCHLILAVHNDPAVVVWLLQTRPFDKNLCELTEKKLGWTKAFWQIATLSKLQATEAMILWPL